MSSTRPFLNRPFGPSGDPWQAMSADQRTIWEQWSEGNPTADIDFQTRLRSGRANFYNLSQNGSLIPRTWNALDFPPAQATFEHGIVGINYAAFDPDNGLQIYLRTTNIRPVICYIWATPQRPPTSHLTLSGMKYVTHQAFAAGTSGGTKSADFLLQYRATFEFPDLVTGNRAALFVFLMDNYQIELSQAADLVIYP